MSLLQSVDSSIAVTRIKNIALSVGISHVKFATKIPLTNR